MRDLKWMLTGLEGSNSVRLLSFWKLTTLQTQQFCKTSSKKHSCQHQKGSNSARLPSKLESWVLSWQPRTFFHPISLKHCACHEKARPGHTKCFTCHAKSSWQSWRSDAPKCSPSQQNQRPDLRISLIEMSLVLRLPRDIQLQIQMRLQLHYITQHYTTLITLHYTTNTTAIATITKLHYTTLH